MIRRSERTAALTGVLFLLFAALSLSVSVKQFKSKEMEKTVREETLRNERQRVCEVRLLRTFSLIGWDGVDLGAQSPG